MEQSDERIKRISGLVVIAALMVLVAGLGLFSRSDNASAATTAVLVGQQNGGSVSANQFNAASIAVSTGDTVRWTRFAGSHNVVSAVVPAGAAAFDFPAGASGTGDPMVAGTNYDKVVTTAGTYTYFCNIHAGAGDASLANIDASIASGKMVGKIVASAPLPDTTAPTASAVAANPNPTNGSSSVTLTATITDTGAPLGTIASAQYRIDGGAPVSMSAADGTFNGSTENVTANVPVGGLSLANHTVEVRGTDAATNVGAWVALTGGLNVTATPAGAVQASVTIQGGNLTNTAQNIGFGSIALAGGDQTVPATPATWQAKDARGTGDGWNVTLSSTDFSGAGTIPMANFKIRQPQAAITTVSGNTAPSSLVTSFQSLSGAPLKVLQATGGAGMGTYDYTPDFQLTVPASSVAGSYTANVTVSINSGP